MNSHDKKRMRAIKREVKRAGNKKVRAKMKRDLAENPEDTHFFHPEYGELESRKYNGIDRKEP